MFLVHYFLTNSFFHFFSELFALSVIQAAHHLLPSRPLFVQPSHQNLSAAILRTTTIFLFYDLQCRTSVVEVNSDTEIFPFRC